MRTLFLNGNKAKPHRARVARWCGLLLLLILSWLAMLDGTLKWATSSFAILAMALMAGLAVFAGRWIHLQRIKSNSRNLKDSALW